MLQLRNIRVCRLVPRAALMLLALLGMTAQSIAQELGKNWDTQTEPAGVGSREIWFGADAGAHNWLVYTGATYAPFGDIHADGFRMRATSGYGQYDFTHHRELNLTRVDVTKTYADAMIGYQFRSGELTAKAFVGMAVLSSSFEAPTIVAHDTTYGVKGALEFWLRLVDQAARHDWAIVTGVK